MSYEVGVLLLLFLKVLTYLTQKRSEAVSETSTHKQRHFLILLLQDLLLQELRAMISMITGVSVVDFEF